MADGHIPEPAQSVDILMAMDVLDHRPPTLYPDFRILMGTGMVERMDKMGVVGLDRIDLSGHGASSYSLVVDNHTRSAYGDGT